MRLSTSSALALVVLSSALTVAHGQPLGPWQRIRSDEGITSYQREAPDQALPAFRARAILPHPMWNLLAILEDVDRASEWTAHCGEMREVRRISPHEMLVYARMSAPWPVRDRDVLVRVSIRFERDATVLVSIRSVADPSVPPHAGIVRIPRMVASYAFRALEDGHTAVQYELEVDPGGTLPDWLKTMVSRDLAHDTLGRLRQRAASIHERSIYEQRAQELEATARRAGLPS